MWLFIYIFILFIILTPSFLFKEKLSIQIYFIHSLLFTLVLYLTYDSFEKKIFEGLNVSLSVDNPNAWIDILKTFRQKCSNLTIQNNVAEVP